MCAVHDHTYAIALRSTSFACRMFTRSPRSTQKSKRNPNFRATGTYNVREHFLRFRAEGLSPRLSQTQPTGNGSIVLQANRRVGIEGRGPGRGRGFDLLGRAASCKLSTYESRRQRIPSKARASAATKCTTSRLNRKWFSPCTR